MPSGEASAAVTPSAVHARCFAWWIPKLGSKSVSDRYPQSKLLFCCQKCLQAQKSVKKKYLLVASFKRGQNRPILRFRPNLQNTIVKALIAEGRLEDMSKAKSTFKKNDVKRAIAELESAGKTAARVEFGKDGFAIIPGAPGDRGAEPLPSDKTALDGWMASHARSA